MLRDTPHAIAALDLSARARDAEICSGNSFNDRRMQ